MQGDLLALGYVPVCGDRDPCFGSDVSQSTHVSREGALKEPLNVEFRHLKKILFPPPLGSGGPHAGAAGPPTNTAKIGAGMVILIFHFRHALNA